MLSAFSSGTAVAANAAREPVLVPVCSPRKIAVLKRTATNTITRLRNRTAKVDLDGFNCGLDDELDPVSELG